MAKLEEGFLEFEFDISLLAKVFKNKSFASLGRELINEKLVRGKENMEIELMKESEIGEVCEMILRACKGSEFVKFYPEKYIECSKNAIKKKSEMGHFYAVKDSGKIVGCGGIGPYWGSATESWIFTIAVDPDYQKMGIGKKIIEFLENDEYAKMASRLEVHAAMSAIPFYRKLGYEHKNGDLCYKDGHFDLEKFF